MRKINVLYGDKSYAQEVAENREFLQSIDKNVIKKLFLTYLSLPQIANVIRVFQDTCQHCEGRACTCYTRKDEDYEKRQ